jgi:hypothetical protein
MAPEITPRELAKQIETGQPIRLIDVRFKTFEFANRSTLPDRKSPPHFKPRWLVPQATPKEALSKQRGSVLRPPRSARFSPDAAWLFPAECRSMGCEVRH